MTKFIPRDYQLSLANETVDRLKKYKIAYLAVQVRVGKTHLAFIAIKKYGAKNVLFVSKKKALGSIKDDFEHHKEHFNATIINYESLHKVEGEFDLLILDEIHNFIGSFPKPSRSHKAIKKEYSHLPIIMLSGSPLIESASKIFHQLGVSIHSPFKEYGSFYKWFRDYGKLKKIYIGSMSVNDYSETHYDKLIKSIDHLIISFTQSQAGFTTDITEHILDIKMQDKTYNICKRLIKDKVIPGKHDSILADTGAKLQICLHQLYSGTIKLDSGEAITIDDTKAKYIKNYFKGKKIAIMYCFVQEKHLLKGVFGDTITDDLEEFKTTDKNYMGQIVANREGVSLKEADALVFFTMPFSGVSYVQGRDRCSYLGRKENNVYIACTVGGLDKKIYRVVKNKKNFTNKIFKQEIKSLT